MKSKLNMFGTKSVSTVLFYGTRILAIGYSLFSLFVLFALVSGFFLTINDDQFNIALPYSDSVIKGDYDITVFIAIVGFMLFYTLFFFFLSKVFQEFKGTSPFTKKAIQHITYFVRLNMICPFLYIIIALIAIQEMIPISEFISAMLHVALGLFAWFIVIVFRRGFELQEDNNLTI